MSEETKLSTPALRVDTQSTPPTHGLSSSLSNPLQTPTSATSPTFHIPLTPSELQVSPSAHLAKLVSFQNASHAKDESRKLLGLLLAQLYDRPRPPSVFELSGVRPGHHDETSIGQIFGAVKNTRTSFRQRQNNILAPSTKEDSDDDDNSAVAFSTDATFELMVRLKEVLLFSISQRWQIFEASSIEHGVEGSPRSKPSSPLNLRISTRRSGIGSRRSRSLSPTRQDRIPAPELLTQCISTLASIISEDCRFQISSPRPSRPPNALQWVTLDVAQLLVQLNRQEPSVISRIAFAVTPGFSTFSPEMYPRLLAFFDNVILRSVLADLASERGETMVDIPKRGEHLFVQTETFPVSIQVVEAQDEESGAPWRPWGSPGKHTTSRVQSSNAPLQPLPVYCLSALLPPLLAAVLEIVSTKMSLLAAHHLCRLIQTLVTSKKDAYLDVLQVVAYHTSDNRRKALSLLTTFWPAAMGHIVVAKALPPFGYTSMVEGSQHPTTHSHHSMAHPYAHSFVPWRFRASDQLPVFRNISLQICRSCSSAIQGFGLLCTACMYAVHFDCYDYPDGNVLLQYAATSDGNSGKMVVHRYCVVPHSTLNAGTYKIRKAHHTFVLVHIFTLPLCVFCRDPVWGCQALHCTSCKLFVHIGCVTSNALELPHCGSIELNSTDMTVSLTKVRQSFTDFYGDLFLSFEDLGKRSYEEISVSSATLWIQLQIYNNGLALGSFAVTKQDPDSGTQDFELPYLVELYEAYLSSGKLPVSASLTEYLHANKHQASSHLIMFDWSTLAYIASAVKAPYETQTRVAEDSKGFLKVDDYDDVGHTDDDVPRHPYEVVPLSHIRDALGYEFSIFSEGPARHCLSHLHRLGFFCCVDQEPLVLIRSTSNDRECYFPLPLGFDLSVDVETLVSAIESCLSDIDLSVNEVGFLLLMRRFLPNGLMSEYALRRLTRALLGWILSEDDSLATILREYVSLGRELPGVRAASDPIPWPFARDSRRIPSSSVNNGGDYVASRRALLHAYVVEWLLTLHNQDVSAFPSIVFDATHEIATEYACSTNLLAVSQNHDRHWDIADRCLKFILKLYQASVTFTALDELFLLWLKSLEYDVLDKASFPTLQRLLNRDGESAARFSTYVDATLANADDKGLQLSDLWGAARRFAGRADGITSGLMWLRLFARSGVEIDSSTIAEFSNMMLKTNPTLAQGSIFMEAVLISAWLKSMGRQELQPEVAKIMAFFHPAVQASLQSASNMSLTAITFVRRCLSICLLLYGCDRRLLLSSGMVNKEEIDGLPARKKLNVRTERAVDPVIVDQDLILTLNDYIQCGCEELAGLAAQFLHFLMTSSSFLEAYEIDNFILRNGKTLCLSVWKLYDVHDPRISNVRTSLLLRILVVDVVPFRALLMETFSSSSPWESRLCGACRLFRVIMDVKSPAFRIEDRQWRLSVLDVFYFFFQLMWLDPKEEIRTAVGTWSQTLLPPHLEAIATCWNGALPALQQPERLRLVTFLIQLQPHFPTWKILSWNVVVEVLLEGDSERAGKEDILVATGPGKILSKEPDLDLLSLKTAMILLSLQMMESGSEVDVLTLLKLKLHLAKVLGFTDVEAIATPGGKAFFIRFEQLETMPASCFPCVHALPRILDAPHDFELPPSVMGSSLVDEDKPCHVLIGTVFVDLVLAIMCSSLDLLALPVLTLKNLLEALLIITFKHDFDSMTIKHLDVSLRKALRKALDLLLLDISYELRQLALSVVQTHIRKGTGISGVLAVDSMDKATALIVSLRHNKDDFLVSQATSFIEYTLVTLTPSGIFCSLCRRPPNPDFYEILKGIINGRNGRESVEFQEDLLRSIILQPPEVDWKVTHNTVQNINMFVEVVLSERVNDTVLKDLATWTVATARRASGLSSSNDFDLNSLICLVANLMRFRRPSIHHDLFICLETIFRTALLRCDVRKETISLLCSAATHGSSGSTDAITLATQSLSRIMVENLDDILRLKIRVTPVTIISLVEVSVDKRSRGYDDDGEGTLKSALQTLARSALYFLQNHSWTTNDTDSELAASVAVGRLIFHAADQGYHVLGDLDDENNSQRQSRADTTIRSWIVLLLAALSDRSSAKHATLLLSQFEKFLHPYTKILGAYVLGQIPLPEMAAADIEYAYLAMKSWLLLLHKLSPDREMADPRGELTQKLWNELWPPFESLAKLLWEESSDEILPLLTAVWSSVANLFILVLQMRSAIAMDTIPCLALLDRLKQLGGKNSALNKLAKALDGDVLPELQKDNIISQMMKDTANAEKLRSLDRYQKATADRRRVPT